MDETARGGGGRGRICLIVIGWELLSRAYGKPLLFPGPVDTGSALVDGLSGGDIRPRRPPASRGS